MSKKLFLTFRRFIYSSKKILCVFSFFACCSSFSTEFDKLFSTTTTTTMAAAEELPKGQKIDATEIAEPFRAETQRLISCYPEGFKPLLVGFLASDDAGSKKYAQWTAASCKKDGIEFELRECLPLELEEKLEEANADEKVHGIIIYYPCFGASPSFFGGSMDDHLRDSVAIEKDVEGLCATYRQCLYHNIRFLPKLEGGPSEIKSLLPCTPLALVKTLEHFGVYDKDQEMGNHMTGKIVTIVNRSEIVGRPLAAMLANDGADVYSVDIDSIFLLRRGKMLPSDKEKEAAVRASDVIILGVPSKQYKLPIEWIKPGAVVLNVSHFKNVDEKELLETVPGVRYVGAVGKVTIAMLERNLIRLIQNFHLPGKDCKVLEAGGRVVPK